MGENNKEEKKREPNTRSRDVRKRENNGGKDGLGRDNPVQKRRNEYEKQENNRKRQIERGMKKAKASGSKGESKERVEPVGEKEKGRDKLGDNETDAKSIADKYGLLDKKEKGNFQGDTNKGFNPFSYASIKENVVDKGIDKGAKDFLNRHAFGMGTFLEKVNKRFTGDEKVKYSKKMNWRGKVLVFLITMIILFMAWAVAALALMLVIFGAAGLFMDEGNVDGGGGGVAGSGGSDSRPGYTSGKAEPMPPELVGKFILPNTEKATSMVGKRVNPTNPNSPPRQHKGTDFTHAIPGKTDVKLYPVAPGKVYYVKDGYANGKGTGWGNYVRIDHGGYTSLYGHLSPGITVRVGDEVGINSLIGIMGHTGNSTGYHLHLEMYLGGQRDHGKDSHWRDPMSLLSCTDTKPMPPGRGLKTECYNYQKEVRGIQ